MCRSVLALAMMGLLPVTSGIQAATFSACDLNLDGVVNVVDVQLITIMSLGLLPCTANIQGPGVCNSLAIQQVTNAAAGQACMAVNSHSVTLNWTASTTPGISYNVYRATTAGGPYIKLTTTPVSTISYVDATVAAGQMYYYVTTAVNSKGESTYSNEARAAIPVP